MGDSIGFEEHPTGSTPRDEKDIPTASEVQDDFENLNATVYVQDDADTPQGNETLIPKEELHEEIPEANQHEEIPQEQHVQDLPRDENTYEAPKYEQAIYEENNFEAPKYEDNAYDEDKYEEDHFQEVPYQTNPYNDVPVYYEEINHHHHHYAPPSQAHNDQEEEEDLQSHYESEPAAAAPSLFRDRNVRQLTMRDAANLVHNDAKPPKQQAGNSDNTQGGTPAASHVPMSGVYEVEVEDERWIDWGREMAVREIKMRMEKGWDESPAMDKALQESLNRAGSFRSKRVPPNPPVPCKRGYFTQQKQKAAHLRLLPWKADFDDFKARVTDSEVQQWLTAHVETTQPPVNNIIGPLPTVMSMKNHLVRTFMNNAAAGKPKLDADWRLKLHKEKLERGELSPGYWKEAEKKQTLALASSSNAGSLHGSNNGTRLSRTGSNFVAANNNQGMTRTNNASAVDLLTRRPKSQALASSSSSTKLPPVTINIQGASSGSRTNSFNGGNAARYN